MEQIGPYRILAELGRGGMGVVYKAHDPRTGRDVALKLVLGLQPTASQRLEREARALARVQHPGIAAVHELGQHQGAPFLVMDHVEGVSLQAYLDREGPFGVAEALQIVNDVGQALHAAHQAGVLHRDLKPDNVLMTPRGRVVLIDFGLAKATGDELQRLTRTGQLLGTPGYWPPELARGEQAAIGPHSDVYGLAATLYALVTGHAPHEGQSLIEVVTKLDEPAPPPSSWNPQVPPALDHALLRALAPDPRERPADVPALLATLAGVDAPTGRARRIAVGVALLVLPGLGLIWLGARGLTPGPAAPRASAPTTPPSSPATGSLDPPSSPPPASPSLDALIEQVRSHLAAGDLDPARAACDRALALAPDDPRGWFQRSLVRLQQGDRRGARDDSSRAIRLDPSFPNAHGNRGALRFGLEDHAGALEDYRAELRLQPQAAPRLERELAEIEAHVASLPDQALSAADWLRRGQPLLEADAAAAERCFSRALWLQPDNGPIRVYRAYARELQGDLRGALADLDRAIADGFEHPTAFYNRASVGWRLQEDLAGVVEDATRALTAEPEHREARLTRGTTLAALERYGEAEEDAGYLLARDPDDSRALYLRGTCRAERGQLAQGIPDIERAIELETDPTTLQGFRAQLRRFRGRR